MTRLDGTPLNPGGPLIVVKVGGGLCSAPGALNTVGASLADLGRRRRLLVVPGGGPFADAVREFDRRERVSADAAHWMAILAMDQYAHALVERISGAVLVEEPGAVGAALAHPGVAVLAPYRWLRAADVLPHCWNATSDSVAAFVAGRRRRAAGAIKPASAGLPWTSSTRASGPCCRWGCWTVLGWERIGELEEIL
jgi:aspartokinase-like uncharacterized kinase